MPERFMPLAEFLRPAAPEPAESEPTGDPAPPDAPRGEEAVERDEALSEVRRFRAALADALDLALADLLREIACEVLARELRIAPVDVRALVARAIERIGADAVLAIRAHPGEAGAIQPCGIRVVADASLRRGDLTIELRSGTIDASLGARLDAVLAGTVL